MSFFILPAEVVYHITSYLKEYSFFLRQTCQFFHNTLPSLPALSCLNRVIEDDNLELASFFNLDQIYERPQKRRRMGGGKLFSLLDGNEVKINSLVEKLVIKAIQENYFYLFLWLDVIPEQAKNYSALYGRINFLEFLEKIDKRRDVNIVHTAVNGNQVETLIWLKEHGYPFEGVVNTALYLGNVQLASLLYDLGATYTEDVLYEIIYRGQADSFFYIIKKENIDIHTQFFSRRYTSTSIINEITNIYKNKLEIKANSPPDEKLKTECLGIVEILRKLVE